MKYSFVLTKEEAKSVIETLQSTRHEDEDSMKKQARQTFESQYKEQYKEDAPVVADTDIVNQTRAALGPNFCDTCD